MAPYLVQRHLVQRQSKFMPVWIMCRFEELLYRLVIVPLVAFLPAPLAYRVACLRGDWCYRIDKVKRKQILSNLEGVFGDELSPAERERVARDFFRMKSCQAIDGMRLAGKGRALAQLVEIHGLEHIESALAAGKGAVVCIAHFGSFNSCCSLMGAYGLPITDVGNYNYNPIISLLERLVGRSSIEKKPPHHMRHPNIEPRKGQVEAAIRMAEILRANEVITIAIDVPVSPQDRTHAVSVDFLGRKVLLLPGSVSIAKQTGSPVMVVVALRSPDWRHQVMEISPPVPLDGGIEAAFKRCVALVEAPIRQNLAHWDGCINTQALIDLGLLSTERP